MRMGWKLAAIVAVGAALAGPAVPAAQAVGEQAAVRQVLAAVRQTSSAPGAGFTYGDGIGPDISVSSGTGRLLANDPIGPDDKVRVGSDTKMFVAAVALQLVDEGVLELDVPIEQYVPGVLRYPADKVPTGFDPAAFDGRTVTLRQLLQHTAGIPDYAANILYTLHPLHQVLAPTPENLVAHGTRNGPLWSPGASWRYSNTGYALVGMIVQATTGRSIGTQIAERIVAPLGLTNTFFAERGQKAIPGPHVRGYLTQLLPVDLTGIEPAVWGAAGALVSSAADMNTFMSALLAGEILSPARLADMQDEVPYLAGGYGLGLVRIPLSCGDAWGHAGYLAGYQTFGMAMPDGRHGFLTLNTSLALNLLPPAVPASAADLFELALC